MSGLINNIADWDDVRCFLRLARSDESIRSQFSTSELDRIDNLERQFGISLFRRQAGGAMVLTEGAKEVIPEAERMETMALAFANKLSRASCSVSGTVNIVAPDGIGSYWLLPRIQKVMARYPDIRLMWAMVNRPDVRPDDVFDIGISWSECPGNDIVTKQLGFCTCSLYGYQDYFSRYGRPTSFSDLEHHRLLHNPAYDANPAFGMWNSLIASCRHVVVNDSPAEAHALIRSGEVLSLLPNYATIIEPKLVRVDIDMNIKMGIYLVAKKTAANTEGVRIVENAINGIFEADKEVWFGR